MTYYSKIDPWVLLLLLAVPAGLAAAAIALSSPIFAALCLCTLAVYGLSLLPTSYRLGPEALEIRSGVFRSNIPYNAIHAIRPSNSPLASPALSLKRLEITYGASEMKLVSPRDSSGFLHNLSARVPGLRIE